MLYLASRLSPYFPLGFHVGLFFVVMSNRRFYWWFGHSNTHDLQFAFYVVIARPAQQAEAISIMFRPQIYLGGCLVVAATATQYFACGFTAGRLAACNRGHSRFARGYLAVAILFHHLIFKNFYCYYPTNRSLSQLASFYGAVYKKCLCFFNIF